MAIQTVDTVIITDLANPVELQTWFTNHPLAVITAVTMESNVFYVIHT
jgi:hypothetical protein